ncbi:transmembrane protein 186 [Cimex lectularius]|uniref:Transmembrane protein 186 n=1 Tax=Cimex lectularius TaxID=79782 RepID=A0A8I6TMV3_CIMLE|nr:transmembrane protein 186 [Cimex lectularius]
MFQRTISRHLINTVRRSLSNGTLQEVKNNEKISETKGFNVIYRFTPILIGSLVNRLKKIQLYITCTTVPVSYGFFLTDYCSGDLPVSVATLCGLSMLGTAAIGQFFTRTIGFIYISDDGQEVKLSYVDFWGRRKNICLPPDEILPLSHSPRYFTDMLYQRVFLTTSVKPLKLMKFGEITNTEGFYKIFDLQTASNTKEINDN